MKTPRTPSPSGYQFGRLPNVEHQRSTFRRDCRRIFTFDSGKLIPFYVDEILPGDSVSLNATLVGRLSTPVVPIMDDIMVDTHFFFVPNRLLWENWEKFCGAQDNPGDSTDFLVPQITCPSGGWAENSLQDYMGVPTKIENLDVNSLHTRAYNLIWNEFFRDQDLQDSLTVDTGNGPDLDTDYVVRRRAKRPDYFTTCRPFLQKGDDVTLPLGSSAPVVGDGVNPIKVIGGSSGVSTSLEKSGADAGVRLETTTSWGALENLYLDNPSGMVADLSNATASTISALRFAFQYQLYLERNARSGTRYVEHLAAHWGVTSPDFRLQRPEYLGGGTQSMQFQTVPNQNLSGSNEATLGAFGVIQGSRNGFFKSFVEHGVIIGLVSTRTQLTYQQGLHRMWSRQSFIDFHLPVFNHLSEQAVLNKEIFAQGTSADDDVFGYQERWAEYRYGTSYVSGAFRSNYTGTLDFWHFALDFSSLPLLNDTFIQDSPPISRALAVTSEPEIIMDSYFSIKHTRPMPVYSIPGLTDHF